MVAPFTGAWIEISITCVACVESWSLPSRERGLKYYLCIVKKYVAWSLPSRERGLKCYHNIRTRRTNMSLPSRERGLKSDAAAIPGSTVTVAPFTGAWIEILVQEYGVLRQPCRSLHGSVD